MWEAVARVEAGAADCAAAAVWAWSDGELVEGLERLTVVESLVTAARAHLVRELDSRGLPAGQGASSTTVWLRERLRISVQAARRLVELGRELAARPALDKAVCAGLVNVEQAAAIAGTVADLAREPEVSASVVDQAEVVLVEQAAQLGPLWLRKVGERVLAHVAPEVAERVDAAIVARQEARAAASRTLKLTATGDGRVRLTGWLDAEGAAVISAAIDPLSSRRRIRGGDGVGASRGGGLGDADHGVNGSAMDGERVVSFVPTTVDDRTPGQRRADALVDVCRLALRTAALPANGGDRPQVVVTVPYDVTRSALGIGQLDTGERLTATQVRKLACDALVIPAVLDGDGQILDYGRSRRLVTGPLRRALALRDKGCAFPGCDRPPRWCDAHHMIPWEEGGCTDLSNCVLLCPYHHGVVHRDHWIVRLADDGQPEFVPPEFVDPTRTPRRNLYHRRL